MQYWKTGRRRMPHRPSLSRVEKKGSPLSEPSLPNSGSLASTAEPAALLRLRVTESSPCAAASPDQEHGFSSARMLQHIFADQLVMLLLGY